MDSKYEGTDPVAHEKANLSHRAGITNPEVIDYYQSWADEYEKVGLTHLLCISYFIFVCICFCHS
jgi:hypothetical protein